MTTENFDLDTKLTQWAEAVKEADYWKLRENELRKEIFNQMFPEPVRGMNKLKISHGMALIAEHRLNYRIDRAQLDMGLSDQELEPIIRQIVNFEPKVSGSKFENLSDNEKKMIGPMITVTPGTPGLTIKPQNKVRW